MIVVLDNNECGVRSGDRPNGTFLHIIELSSSKVFLMLFFFKDPPFPVKKNYNSGNCIVQKNIAPVALVIQFSLTFVWFNIKPL